jgi:drug/metabolite transporter (DMT)-like permease
MTDIYTQAVIFGVCQTTCFLIMSLVQRLPVRATIRSGLYWIAMAGILDGSTILLQFAAYRYIDVVVVISIKRAGIILSVFCGWIFFRERNIRDRLMAASIIFVGVTILYSPLSFGGAAAIAVACVVVAWIYVLWARRREEPALHADVRSAH